MPYVIIALAAAAATPGGDATAQRLLACRAITAADARLACFDREAATMAAALATDRVRVVDVRKEKREQEARFGLPTPAAVSGQLTHVETEVAGASQGADGRTFFTLADGSRWRQVDDYPLPHAPKAGDPVVIDLTSLGSYKLRVGKQAPIRVRRADRS